MNELAWLKTKIAAATVGILNGLFAGAHWINANISTLTAYASLIVLLLTMRNLIAQWRRERRKKDAK